MSSTLGSPTKIGLEAALEGGVLLDVLAVLVERRGADGAQLAAREHRLQKIGCVDRALGGAGADDRVELVHEEDDLALGGLDLLEDGLEALLELAAVLGAGEQGADVEGDHPPVAKRLGDVARDDPLGEPLDDRGLADAGVADQDGVVLGAAGEDLDDAADLLVAADHRIELAALRLGGQVAPVLLERAEGVLRVRRGDAMGAADLGDRLDQFLAIGQQVGDAGLAARPGRAGCARSRCTRRRGRSTPSRPAAAPRRTRSTGGRPGRCCRSAGAACRSRRGPWRARPARRRRGAAEPARRRPRPAPAGRGGDGAERPRGSSPRTASRCAAATASWDLIVNRSGCIADHGTGFSRESKEIYVART